MKDYYEQLYSHNGLTMSEKIASVIKTLSTNTSLGSGVLWMNYTRHLNKN